MLTEEQNRIYTGLKNIGETLANFYLDGLTMSRPDCTLKSRANLIAHMARELDGGLRDVFTPHKLKAQNEALLPVKQDKNGHLASILAVIGTTDLGNKFAQQWLSVVSRFWAIAHRENIHQESTDPTVILNLWEKYEKILLAVVGSYIGITTRLDVWLGQDEPDVKALPALKNVLKNEKHAQYFFSRLHKEFWISHLEQEGYFSPETAPKKVEGQSEPAYWYPIYYLKNISSTAKRKRASILIEVIGKMMAAYMKDEIELNSFVVDDLAGIIGGSELLTFGEKERLFFEKYSSRINHSWPYVNATICEKVVTKIIDKQDKDGLTHLLNYFFGFTTVEEPSISFFGEENPKPFIRQKPFVDKALVDNLIKNHGKAVINIIGSDAIRLAIKKIVELDSVPDLAFANFSMASIEPTGQSVYSSDWSDELVYFIRDYAVELRKEDLEVLVDEMMLSKIRILQRVAIHLIRVRYADLNKRWWDFVEETGYDDNIHIHEPYILLKEQSDKFSDEQFERIVQWIETINMPEVDMDEMATSNKAYHIRRWLSALVPASEKSKLLLQEKIQYYTGLNSFELDHPEFNSYGTSHIGFDYPMGVEEFQALSLSEQVNYIIDFKPQQAHDSTEDGLAEIIRYSVAADPEKYIYDLDQFLPLHSMYLNSLIIGFKDALAKEDSADYSPVIGVIENVVESKDFEGESKKGYYNIKWFGSSVSEYVSALIANDKKFDVTEEDCLRLINLVTLMINKREFNDEDEDVKDGYGNYILNSTIGRLYSALLDVTRFRSEKFIPKIEEIKWPAVVKQLFTEKLNSSEVTDRAYSMILGLELPLLRYLDKQWVNDHVEEMFDVAGNKNSSYRLVCLFSRNYQPNKDTYNFLKSHDLFLKALNTLEPSGAFDTVIEYALLEWKFWGVDPDSADSLLTEIFKLKNAEVFKRLIDVVWHMKNYFTSTDAIYLWQRLLLSFNEIPEQTPPYSMLSWLFELTDSLDQVVYDLAHTTISNLSENKHAYEILRQLYRIGDTNIEKAATLVSLLYEKKVVSIAFQHELIEFTAKVYAAGFKAIADGICIHVSDTGSLALKELYNRHM